MPKLVTELAQGNVFSRSSDGGALADSATRVFKVILNEPNEALDIFAAIGVNIGDLYSVSNPIPCVSVEGRADGESRLVRIITAQYRTSAGMAGGGGSGGGGGGDPKSYSPEVRPPTYSIQTSLQEVPAWGWRKKLAGDGYSQNFDPPANPLGDIYDGVTALSPITTITVDQYSPVDGSAALQYVGHVNKDNFLFSNLPVAAHHCMLQSVASKGHVESFGGATFRGYLVTFTFQYRKLLVPVAAEFGGTASIGWDMVIPVTGFNVKNDGLGRADVDRTALALKHVNYKVDGWPNGVAYANNTQGKKVRAHVIIAARGEDDGAVQNLSAQPVALNLDGTPRKAFADDFGAAAIPPVILARYATQPEMDFGDNFANFGIRNFF